MTVRLESVGSRAAELAIDGTAEAATAADTQPAVAIGAAGVIRTVTAAMADAVRADRVGQDRQVVERAAQLLLSLSSPDAMLQLAQSWIRDAQHDQREQGARTEMSSARIDSELRERRIDEAEQAQANSDFWSEVSRGLAIAAAAIGTIAAVASSIVTGGAGLVAAAGLVIAVLGPLIAGELQRAGVLDGESALAMSTVCVVIGSALSFGAGAAGGAAGAASTAAQAISTVGQVGSAAAQTAQASTELVSAQYTRDADDRTTESVAAGHDVDEHQGAAEDEVADLRTVMRLFARIAEKLRATVLARGEALRAASGARA